MQQERFCNIHAMHIISLLLKFSLVRTNAFKQNINDSCIIADNDALVAF